MPATALALIFCVPALLGLLAIGRSRDNAPRAVTTAGIGFVTTGVLWAVLLLTKSPADDLSGDSKILVGSPFFIVGGLSFVLVGLRRSRTRK